LLHVGAGIRVNETVQEGSSRLYAEITSWFTRSTGKLEAGNSSPSRLLGAFGRICSLYDSGLGPILVAGPLVAWIVAGLEGAVEAGALGALGAGLFSIGIPKNSIVKCETAIKTDQFVEVAHGTAAEVAKAKDIIETTHPVSVTMHAAEAVAGLRRGRMPVETQARN